VLLVCAYSTRQGRSGILFTSQAFLEGQRRSSADLGPIGGGDDAIFGKRRASGPDLMDIDGALFSDFSGQRRAFPSVKASIVSSGTPAVRGHHLLSAVINCSQIALMGIASHPFLVCFPSDLGAGNFWLQFYACFVASAEGQQPAEQPQSAPQPETGAALAAAADDRSGSGSGSARAAGSPLGILTGGRRSHERPGCAARRASGDGGERHVRFDEEASNHSREEDASHRVSA